MNTVPYHAHHLSRRLFTVNRKTLRELLDLAKNHGVDLSGSLEKQDVGRRLVDAGVKVPYMTFGSASGMCTVHTGIAGMCVPDSCTKVFENTRESEF